MTDPLTTETGVDAENSALNLRIKRLEAALWKYGKHLSHCALWESMGKSCTCGWARLRETLAGDALRPTEREQFKAALKGMLTDYRSDGCPDPNCGVCQRSNAAEKVARDLL